MIHLQLIKKSQCLSIKISNEYIYKILITYWVPGKWKAFTIFSFIHGNIAVMSLINNIHNTDRIEVKLNHFFNRFVSEHL